MTDMQDDRFYTIAEVAHLLKVHPRTLSRWAEQGKITMITLPGGKFRITAAELERITTQTAQTEGSEEG